MTGAELFALRGDLLFPVKMGASAIRLLAHSNFDPGSTDAEETCHAIQWCAEKLAGDVQALGDALDLAEPVADPGKG